MVREKVFAHNNAQIMERKMWQFILGSTGFILYFIYDINSVRMKNAVLQKFFAAGSILVVVSLIAELYTAWGELPSEDRNNDRIWIRRIPFPLSAHLYVVFCASL